MKEKKEKKPEGRPTKLTAKLIDALNEVLVEKDIIVMTDEELVMFVNEKLNKEDQISYITFKKWKAGEMPEINADKENIEMFLSVIKKALFKERENLLKELKKDGQWQKYAWILERKFDEWNLKSITDSKVRFPDGIPPLKADIDLSPENIKKINDVINCC